MNDNTCILNMFCAPGSGLALLGIIFSNLHDTAKHREVKELAQGHTVIGRAGFDLRVWLLSLTTPGNLGFG